MRLSEETKEWLWKYIGVPAFFILLIFVQIIGFKECVDENSKEAKIERLREEIRQLEEGDEDDYENHHYRGF